MSQVGFTTLVNNALILLGSSARITDIDGPGSLTAQARDLFPVLIPQLLVQHPWNFALTRTSVPRANVDALAGRWEWKFQLPADNLRWLPWDREDDDWFDAVEESGFLLSSDEGPIVIRYIADVQDVSRWSPLFKSAFVALLADYLAETVAASQSQRDRAVARFDEYMSQAKRVDGLAGMATARLRPENLSNAVRAMTRSGGGDPARWHR